MPLTDRAIQQISAECETTATNLVAALREMDQRDGLEMPIEFYDRSRLLEALKRSRGITETPHSTATRDN